MINKTVCSGGSYIKQLIGSVVISYLCLFSHKKEPCPSFAYQSV